MNIDYSTLLGVLGVVLTILFFVVGYRQTIGARKERARAANKIAADAIFRRLTLEDKFETDPLAINRLLSGWALEARVRLSDMYSSEDMHAVLLCRIVESDYLTGDKRREVMHRLAECFKEARQLSHTEEPPRRVARFGTEVVLALGSAATALVGTTIAAFFATNGPAKDTLTTASATTLLEILSSITVMIVLTATALTLFTRLRESTRSTDEREILSAREGLAFEQSFINAARRANSSVEAELGWPDLAFKEGDGRVAVELKGNLDAVPTPRLRTLIADTERRRDAGGYSCALIVSPRTLRSRARGIETEKVKVAAPSEVLDRIRAAA